MANSRYHFSALLKQINPGKDRVATASRLPSEVREWLKEHEFETCAPHTRLGGSYARSTAILNIKDVDAFVFLPESQLDRTPNAVLLQLKRVLEEYPEATLNTVGQRRSIRLEFSGSDLDLDIVPAVASGGVDCALKVPDRPRAEWIDSDPLGYAERLSRLNADNAGKVVPLVKLVKAWRDVQFKTRRPKSYVLEVMVLYAVEGDAIRVVDESIASAVAQFFMHVSDKYDDLMENGFEAPRMRDPQIPGNLITRGWERSHFETFMRRSREAAAAAEQALDASSDAAASEFWRRLYGDLWPDDEAVAEAVRAEGASIQPGATQVASTGRVIGGVAPFVSSCPTRFHGD